MFDALVFAVHDCGFVARSAFETDDATQVRVTKILKIISSSKYGIHDISCTSVSGPHKLPRFNMPLELGLFMGAKHFGGSVHRRKRGLVLDRDFLSGMHVGEIVLIDIHENPDRTHVREREALRSPGLQQLPR